ncbi:MAG: peroxidase-related enzyme [Alphaproteobacteria bacterium]
MKDPDQLWALDIEPDLDALDDDMKKYFDVCRDKLGLLPNVLRAYGFNPAKLAAYVDSYNQVMLGESALSKLEREMIAVAVSSANKCVYCLVAHGSAVRHLSGDPILGEMIAHNYRIADLTPRHRAMLDFAVKLTEAPARIGEADRASLRDAGFDDAAIFDIAEVTGFFNMSNRVASAVEMMPNPAYHTMAR